MRQVALRPLALPYEHGAWGFLLEPIAVGLLIAPSWAGVFIAAGVVALFLARHPFRLAARDHLDGKRYPRTAACEVLALIYASIASAAFAAAGARALVPLLFAIPFAATQLVLDLRRRGRGLAAEVAGAVAPGAAATAIVLAAAQPAAVGVALWAILAARAAVSILYVRCSLRGDARALMLAAHVAAVALAFALAAARFVSPGAVVAMIVLLARAVPSGGSLSARQIGMRELGYGTIVVLLVAM